MTPKHLGKKSSVAGQIGNTAHFPWVFSSLSLSETQILGLQLFNDFGMWRLKNNNNKIVDFVRDDREMPGEGLEAGKGTMKREWRVLDLTVPWNPRCLSQLRLSGGTGWMFMEQIPFLTGDWGPSAPSPGQSQLWRDRLWDAYSEKSMLKCHTKLSRWALKQLDTFPLNFSVSQTIF